MVVYGGCSWITAHRSHVGTWYYSWESYIPLVPIMIIPYMSINLFFVCGPFICQSRNELHVLAQRITFAILIAGVCFLLIPPCGYQVCVHSPPTGRDRFSNFYIFSTSPITCFLHCILLSARFLPIYTRGIPKEAVRWASHVWFILIGFSTLLTWQHHFVDIIGGFVLAAICFYLFRYENAASKTAIAEIH